MQSQGTPAPNSMAPEDSFFELLAETLANLDQTARGQFLQQFFKCIAQLDLSEAASLEHWNQILDRRRELANRLDKPVSIKTAMMDILASSSYLRVPIMMEYDELKKLQISAATDPLTGLYNRRLFHEQFDKELNRAQRYNEHLALVLLDLHHFKQVNDRYGHPQGDVLLQTAAATIRKSLRASDYAFRIGGDEFALLLVQSDMEQASTLARRLRTNFVSDVQPMQMNADLDLDYGVAVFANDGDRRESLVRVADERLYKMKNRQAPGARREGREGQFPAMRPAVSIPSPAFEPRPQPAKKEFTESPQPPPAAERRKWERVSLTGTHASAQLVDPKGTVRALDISYGGIALLVNTAAAMAPTFSAILNVPIFPPVRVTLKSLYQIPAGSGQVRLGCAFVS